MFIQDKIFMQSPILEVVFYFFTPATLPVLATGLTGWHFFHAIYGDSN